jgi:hypothetical protein
MIFEYEKYITDNKINNNSKKKSKCSVIKKKRKNSSIEPKVIENAKSSKRISGPHKIYYTLFKDNSIYFPITISKCERDHDTYNLVNQTINKMEVFKLL